MVTQVAKATKEKNEGTSGEKDVPRDDDKDDVLKGLKQTSLRTKAGTARRTRDEALGTPLPEEDGDDEDSVEEDDDAKDREHGENAR